MNRPGWDQRKLSRIWAQEALGKSIAESMCLLYDDHPLHIR